MRFDDTLPRTLELRTWALQTLSAAWASNLGRPPARVVPPDCERPLEQDLILAGVPTIRGFKVLGDSALYGRLGAGAMGAVYRARHLHHGIDVAVKCLLPGAALARPEVVARFEREAALRTRLDHPNVVQILDSGRCGDLRYLVMEYVHGETLRRRVGRLGPLPIAEAVTIAYRVARGLGAAHRVGLVHRDVKPSNLMIGCSGEVKVCDLGLVKCDGGEQAVTHGAGLLGTPGYMAPEQWREASDVTAAADVHALGACLYFMLTGRDARTGPDVAEARRMALEEPFPDVREERPDVPDALAEVLGRCVARARADRFATGDELALALQASVGGSRAGVLDADADTVPPSQRVSGPQPRELVALRRALARPGRSRWAAVGGVTAGVLARLLVLVVVWAAGRSCARETRSSWSLEGVDVVRAASVQPGHASSADGQVSPTR